MINKNKLNNSSAQPHVRKLTFFMQLTLPGGGGGGEHVGPVVQRAGGRGTATRREGFLFHSGKDNGMCEGVLVSVFFMEKYQNVGSLHNFIVEKCLMKIFHVEKYYVCQIDN